MGHLLDIRAPARTHGPDFGVLTFRRALGFF